MRGIWLALALLLGISVTAFIAVDRDPPDVPTKNEATDMIQTTDRGDEARANYANAPVIVQDLAAALYNKLPLPADALDEATPEMLSAIYDPTTIRGARRNLLLDAFGFDLLPQAQALVAAGADVNVADNLLAWGATNKLAGDRFVPFPDFRPGMPWLRLYVENGGDVNAQEPGGTGTLLTKSASNSNLEALLYLLEHGADGWQPRVRDGFAARNFFESQASGAAFFISGEILFRVARAGHMKSGTPEQLAPVLDILERILADDFDAPGPESQRMNWTVQKATQAVVDHSAAVPSERLRALLAKPVPNRFGGWHLGPDQIRSPNDAETGPITAGSLIWQE